MSKVAGVANIGVRRAWLWRNKSRFQSTASGSRPRLFVDLSAIIRHDAHTGIQRVVRAVWSELASRSGSAFDLYAVHASSRHGYCHAARDVTGVSSGALAGEPARLASGDIFLGLDLSAHVLPKYGEQVRAWRSNGGRICLVVYDLLPILHPKWFTDTAVRNFRKWMDFLTCEVDDAMCISDSVAEQLSRLLDGAGITPRVGRIRMGADMSASRPTTGLCPDVRSAVDQMRARPTVLMVGTIEPRKAYDVALAAFEYWWRHDSQAADLAIVGKGGWKTAVLQANIRSHPQFGKRFRWFDSVSDEGLESLYESALGVLVTSRAEGFGLPLMEAASRRRYVLARDLPVFREQGLQNVIYFQDESPPALAAKLADLRQASSGLPGQVNLPSWSECVDRLLEDLNLAAPIGNKLGAELEPAQ